MIAHLTDLHIGEAGERPKGVPVRENFLGLLEEIQSIEPELLVITGDLSLDTGSREAYRWIRSELDRSGLAYLVMGGNHDDPVMLAEEFGDAAGAESSGEGRYHRHLELGGEELLLLDIPGGTTTPGDVAWLVEALDKSERDEVLLFMHYPPIPLPVAYMERHYTLRGREHIEAAILGATPYIHLFCGHYHGELSAVTPSLGLHLTPSVYFQIDPLREELSVSHRRPGWRYIERYEGRIATGVRYLGL